MALNDGGVMVGLQIASQLHCVLTLLMSAEIMLPRESTAVAGITASGVVSYNSAYSSGEIADMTSEFTGYLEQEKLRHIHELNRLVDGQGTIDKKLLRSHNVIVVSDGLPDAFQVDLACQFLKPIAIKKLIFAVPFASVPAIDRLHVMADDLYCLNVLEDYRGTNHYYDKQDVPDHAKILKTVETMVKQWRD